MLGGWTLKSQGFGMGMWEGTEVQIFSILTMPHTFPGDHKIPSKSYSVIMRIIDIASVNGVYPLPRAVI